VSGRHARAAIPPEWLDLGLRYVIAQHREQGLLGFPAPDLPFVAHIRHLRAALRQRLAPLRQGGLKSVDLPAIQLLKERRGKGYDAADRLPDECLALDEQGVHVGFTKVRCCRDIIGFVEVRIDGRQAMLAMEGLVGAEATTQSAALLRGEVEIAADAPGAELVRIFVGHLHAAAGGDGHADQDHREGEPGDAMQWKGYPHDRSVLATCACR